MFRIRFNELIGIFKMSLYTRDRTIDVDGTILIVLLIQHYR
jgi:hypothetical protein